MKKYVVYLTEYSGNLLPPKYIGSTSESNVVSGKYFGSVSSKKWGKIFHEELKYNQHLFSIQILSLHDTHKKALYEELKQQIKRDVVKSSEYESLTNIIPKSLKMKGESSNFKGKKHTEESKKKIQKAIKAN